MPQKTPKVSVSPGVMRWARESAGLAVEDVAKRVGTTAAAVGKWETGDTQPTLRTLEELATFYKRPLAAFFLPKPPQEPPLPEDFRVLPATQNRALSRQTRLAIREAQRLRARATDLVRAMGLETKPDIGDVRLPADPEKTAQQERQRLGVTLDEQSHWKNPSVAFNAWRNAVEALNILVFQIRVPVEEARGFSLWEGNGGTMAAIIVNGTDAIHAKIFTLFHEYAHLLLGKAGICMPDEGHTETDAPSIEQFCNHFAGALLVPKDGLQKQIHGQTYNEQEEIDRLVARFRVSKQVVWRRMLMTGLIGAQAYQSRLDQWASEETQVRRRRGSGFEPPDRRCIRERGPKFADLVIEAKGRDLITHSEVADYLGLRMKHLDKVEALLGKQK